ncbi:MAG: MBL fold metallo-hydrolase [Chitinophagaceae bacterium]
MDSNKVAYFSRLQFLRSTGLLTAGIFLGGDKLFAQESPVITIKNAVARSPVTIQKLKENFHVLIGAGGNIIVFTGTDGKLLVDAGIANSKQKIIAALDTLGKDPLKYLINTHWHFDHAEGNEWLHKAGATIIAHDNTRRHLSETITLKDWNYTFYPAPQSALPSIVFQTKHEVVFNKTAIHLRRYAPAHTDSDISVYFPAADVLHVGDTWGNASYPFIDHSSGGKLDGIIEACHHNLSVTTDKTIIVPGHGAVGNRSQLLEFTDMVSTIKENVLKLKKSGLTAQQAVAARPTAAYDKKFGNFVVDPATFTRLVYQDV